LRTNKSIREEIRSFRRTRPVLAIPVLIVGAIGLVFPVIPGLALLFLGLMLILPRTGDKLIRSLKEKL